MSVKLSAVIKLGMTNLWHGCLNWHTKLIRSAPKRIWFVDVPPYFHVERNYTSSSRTTDRRPYLEVHDSDNKTKTKYNITVDAPIFTNTCILQFILYLYNILWAFGIPQCVSVKHTCNIGSVFFEGLRMTHWGRNMSPCLYTI